MLGLTKREIVVGLIAVVVATALTIWGTHYVLHRFVLDNPEDPLAKQGGLKPDQNIR